MREVLRAVFARYRLAPGAEAPEATRRRAITVSPKRGGRTIFRDRTDLPLEGSDPSGDGAVVEPVAA